MQIEADVPADAWFSHPLVQQAANDTNNVVDFAARLLSLVDAFEETTGLSPAQAAHFADLADRWLAQLDASREWQVAWRAKAASARRVGAEALHEMLDMQPPEVVARYLRVEMDQLVEWLFPLTPPADLKAAVEGYQAGTPVPVVAALNNISPKTLYRYLRWMRIPAPTLRRSNGTTVQSAEVRDRIRDLARTTELGIKAIQEQVISEFPEAADISYHAVAMCVGRARKAVAA